jgi:hypothetical protein
MPGTASRDRISEVPKPAPYLGQISPQHRSSRTRETDETDHSAKVCSSDVSIEMLVMKACGPHVFKKTHGKHNRTDEQGYGSKQTGCTYDHKRLRWQIPNLTYFSYGDRPVKPVEPLRDVPVQRR